MDYYVIGADGNRYGPSDVQTLRQWVVENRVTHQTMLEDSATGQRIPATSIAGLFDAPPFLPATEAGHYQSAPSPNAPYTRYTADMGTREVTNSFILSAVSWLVCPVVLSAVGLYFANQAAMKGNPSAQGARIFAIVSLCIQGLGALLYIGILILMFTAFSSGVAR